MAELENYISKTGIPTCKFINITPEEQNFKEGSVVLCSYKPEIRCTFIKYNDLARAECVLVDESKGFRFITETFNVILDMNELAKDQKRAKKISKEIEKERTRRKQKRNTNLNKMENTKEKQKPTLERLNEMLFANVNELELANK